MAVSMHLIGHFLNLKKHSVINGAVMSDMGSTGRLIPTELQKDDITRIQKELGKYTDSLYLSNSKVI